MQLRICRCLKRNGINNATTSTRSETSSIQLRRKPAGNTCASISIGIKASGRCGAAHYRNQRNDAPSLKRSKNLCPFMHRCEAFSSARSFAPTDAVLASYLIHSSAPEFEHSPPASTAYGRRGRRGVCQVTYLQLDRTPKQD